MQNLQTNKPVLDYIEIELSEFCNLNCRACCNFSNLSTQKNFYDYREFLCDLDRLSELFCNIREIRLMGGEPFLNPDIVKYAAAIRKVFPKSEIKVVTNGLLIPSLPFDVLKGLAELSCGLDISNYPPTRKKMPEIKKILNEAGIGYSLGFPMNYFFKTILKTPAASPDKAFKNCIFTHCHTMGHGKIAPCSYAYCIYRFNREYGLNYPENDCIDLYREDLTGDKLISFFRKPHEFCRYCSGAMIPIKWQSGVKADSACADDWLIENSHIIDTVGGALQNVLKPFEVELRKKIQSKK